MTGMIAICSDHLIDLHFSISKTIMATNDMKNIITIIQILYQENLSTQIIARVGSNYIT
jgi:hypothetical protein